MQSLILLGASVRAAAFSARRAGFAPHAIDLFADRDLAAICSAAKIRRYPRDFLASLAAAPHSPWIYTGGLENYPRLIDRLAKLRPLLGNGGDVVRQVREPRALAEVASAAGCGTAQLRMGDWEPAATSLKWVVKPRRSGGGLSIHFASAAELARPRRRAYLQEYIPGQSASAVFVAATGRAALLGITQQLVGRDFDLHRPFLYVGSLGPLPLEQPESTQLRSLGHMLAERFGLAGLFNVDFVCAEGRIWPIEVNPRYSASLEVIERFCDVSSIAVHAAACQHGALPTAVSARPGWFAGKAVVYAPRDGAVPAALDRLISEWNQPNQLPGIADVPQVGQPFHHGQPVVTVLADGDSLATIEETLRYRVATVQRLLIDS